MERLLTPLFFFFFLWMAPLMAQAKDCTPRVLESFDEIGLYDRDTWICPVENRTQVPDRSADTPPHEPLNYWMQVLDPRACPVDGFWVQIAGDGWDPTPRWPKGQTFFLFMDAEKRAAIASTKEPVVLSGDPCASPLERSGLSLTAEGTESGGFSEATVVFQPATSSQAKSSEQPLLVGVEGWPRVEVSKADKKRVIRWGDVLSARGEPAATGLNFTGHFEVCPSVGRDASECVFDTDCATCHDGSACGTITTRQSVFEAGAACMQPDSAECESYRVRCCDGRCTARPF